MSFLSLAAMKDHTLVSCRWGLPPVKPDNLDPTIANDPLLWQLGRLLSSIAIVSDSVCLSDWPRFQAQQKDLTKKSLDNIRHFADRYIRKCKEIQDKKSTTFSLACVGAHNLPFVFSQSLNECLCRFH